MVKIKGVKITLIMAATFLLVSCDAINQISYTVVNNTKSKVKLYVPNYPLDINRAEFSERIDTIVELAPNETVCVGFSPIKIGFPWGAKRIYDETPGICGLQQVRDDTLIAISCAAKEWRYKRRQSVFKIK